MPMMTNPMATTVINSAGRSAQAGSSFLSRALRKIKQIKRKPMPAGKNDQVISVEPKVQIECGAPRLMSTTITQPMSSERRVRPEAVWGASADMAGQTYPCKTGWPLPGKKIISTIKDIPIPKKCPKISPMKKGAALR